MLMRRLKRLIQAMVARAVPFVRRTRRRVLLMLMYLRVLPRADERLLRDKSSSRSARSKRAPGRHRVVLLPQRGRGIRSLRYEEGDLPRRMLDSMRLEFGS